MKVFIVDNGTTLLEKLKNLLPGGEEVVCFDSFDARAAATADVIVLSGSSIGPLYGNEQKYAQEINFIKSAQVPIIGICFGCELIVHALGGTLKRLEGHKHGRVEITVIDKKELFCGKETFFAFENHRWGIDALPDDFEILAVSEHGPEVIVNEKRKFYGIQYHPENHTGIYDADDIFLNLFKEVQLKQ